MAGLDVAEQSRSAAESQGGAWSPGENTGYRININIIMTHLLKGDQSQLTCMS